MVELNSGRCIMIELYLESCFLVELQSGRVVIG